MTAPATLMLDPIKTIMTSAVQSVIPGATVLIGQPLDWAQTVVCLAYCWYDDDASQQEHAGPSVIRYTHQFPIHVLVRNTPPAGQEFPLNEAAERTLSNIDAALFDAFFGNRRLSGTAATSTLQQGVGARPTGPVYISHRGNYYRHRMWTLSAGEDRTYNFIAQQG